MLGQGQEVLVPATSRLIARERVPPRFEVGFAAELRVAANMGPVSFYVLDRGPDLAGRRETYLPSGQPGLVVREDERFVVIFETPGDDSKLQRTFAQSGFMPDTTHSIGQDPQTEQWGLDLPGDGSVEIRCTTEGDVRISNLMSEPGVRVYMQEPANEQGTAS